MQGNCSMPPPTEFAAALHSDAPVALTNQQCLLIIDMSLLRTYEGDSSLWLDGLLLAYHRTSRLDQYWDGMVKAARGARLWMTNVVMMGDGDGVGDCTTCGSTVDGSLYMEGANSRTVRDVAAMTVHHVSMLLLRLKLLTPVAGRVAGCASPMPLSAMTLCRLFFCH